MFEIILHYIIFLIIVYANGIIIKNNLFIFNQKNLSLNFFEQSILGLVFTGFLATLFNFFFPLNNFFIYLNLTIGLIILFLLKSSINFKYSKLSKYFVLAIFFLSIIKLYGSGFSDDLNHYHAGYIANTDNHNYIIGLNFLHFHYGYSSIWLILHSYLNFNNSFLQDIHILNSLIFFLVISYFVTESIEKKENSKNYHLYLISSIFVFFFLLKYTRLKEFGLDRPGILIFCFLIYFATKYQYLLNLKVNHKKYFIFIISSISLFITSIKIFFLTSFLVPTIFIFKLRFYKIFLSKLFFIFYFLLTCYILKNILISGCIIYPFDFTCISNLAWNSKEIASNLLLLTEASTKSFDKYNGLLMNYDYIKNFNWIGTWFLRNYEELYNYILTILLTCLTFYMCSKYKKKKIFFNQIEVIIFLLFLTNLLIFLKSPVIRYHHMLFILFAISLIVLIKKAYLKKIFIFNLILIVCLSFNFLKNAKRISKNDFHNNPLEHIKKINWYTIPLKKNIGDFVYYEGWIGAHPIGNMNLKNFKHKKILGFDVVYRGK